MTIQRNAVTHPCARIVKQRQGDGATGRGYWVILQVNSIDMGKTMPTIPHRDRRPQYDYGEGFHTGFGIFMTCAIILFVASIVFLCVKFG